MGRYTRYSGKVRHPPCEARESLARLPRGRGISLSRLARGKGGVELFGPIRKFTTEKTCVPKSDTKLRCIDLGAEAKMKIAPKRKI